MARFHHVLPLFLAALGAAGLASAQGRGPAGGGMPVGGPSVQGLPGGLGGMGTRGGLPGGMPATGPIGGGLPGIGGRLGGLPGVAGGRVTDAVLERAAPQDIRALRIRQLVQAFPERVDLDPRGEPVLRGEFLALSVDDASLEAIARAGFEVDTPDIGSGGLGLDIRLIRDTRGRDARRAMRALRRAAPDVEFAFQHVYLGSGGGGTAVMSAGPASAGRSLRVGLIDSGVDGSHPSLANVSVRRHGCDGRAIPQSHGTTVASRLVDGAGGTLYAADLWCGDAVGRGALGIVDALAWLAREGVPVVNISLVGPSNPAVSRAIQAMQARGHVIVAAVGNDGPAAPPLFPAAYPGVIGVGAVDDRLRVLPESGSGPHVDYVAPGVVPAGRKPVRGTSFAAPVVARAVAFAMPAPAPDGAARVQQALGALVRDLGKPGRDPRYGNGLVIPVR